MEGRFLIKRQSTNQRPTPGQPMSLFTTTTEKYQTDVAVKQRPGTNDRERELNSQCVDLKMGLMIIK